MPPDPVVGAIAIDPLAPAHVLAMEENGSEVHYSASGGATRSASPLLSSVYKSDDKKTPYG
jgi:hypothetical protein